MSTQPHVLCRNIYHMVCAITVAGTCSVCLQTNKHAIQKQELGIIAVWTARQQSMAPEGSKIRQNKEERGVLDWSPKEEMSSQTHAVVGAQKSRVISACLSSVYLLVAAHCAGMLCQVVLRLRPLLEAIEQAFRGM